MNFEAVNLRRVGSAAARRPERVVELPLIAWADIQGKPSSPLPIGLRVPSAQQYRDAESAGFEAESFLDAADEEGRVLAYNQALMVEALAVACCLAVDVMAPFFADGVLEIQRRLTPEGIRRLWQELEVLRISTTPGMPEATDEGFSHLIAIWERGIALDRMPTEEAKKMRRLIEFVRQQMAAVEAEAEAQGVALVAG